MLKPSKVSRGRERERERERGSREVGKAVTSHLCCFPGESFSQKLQHRISTFFFPLPFLFSKKTRTNYSIHYKLEYYYSIAQESTELLIEFVDRLSGFFNLTLLFFVRRLFLLFFSLDVHKFPLQWISHSLDTKTNITSSATLSRVQ